MAARKTRERRAPRVCITVFFLFYSLSFFGLSWTRTSHTPRHGGNTSPYTVPVVVNAYKSVSGLINDLFSNRDAVVYVVGSAVVARENYYIPSDKDNDTGTIAIVPDQPPLPFTRNARIGTPKWKFCGAADIARTVPPAHKPSIKMRFEIFRPAGGDLLKQCYDIVFSAHVARVPSDRRGIELLDRQETQNE